MVHVEEAPAVQRTHRNRFGHPAGGEARQEVVGLLAVDDAREGAVLPLEEDAAVEHHRDQEAGLTLREPEGGHGLGALDRERVDVPRARRRREGHTNSSAKPPSRPPPPRVPRLA